MATNEEISDEIAKVMVANMTAMRVLIAELHIAGSIDAKRLAKGLRLTARDCDHEATQVLLRGLAAAIGRDLRRRPPAEMKQAQRKRRR